MFKHLVFRDKNTGRQRNIQTKPKAGTHRHWEEHAETWIQTGTQWDTGTQTQQQRNRHITIQIKTMTLTPQTIETHRQRQNILRHIKTDMDRTHTDRKRTLEHRTTEQEEQTHNKTDTLVTWQRKQTKQWQDIRLHMYVWMRSRNGVTSKANQIRLF